MKKLVPILVYVTLLCQCANESNLPEINQPLIKHHEASDQFYIQRSWPDGKINLRAYDQAISDANEQMLIKNDLPGFDKEWIVRGPANIGARINTIAVHPENNQVIYVGFAVGGVFKTTDGGQNWLPIFDHNPYLAIGDIFIDPGNPDVVYVGTGDPNISGYPFLGNGIHRSEDGGASWTSLGLENERIVSEIIVHPENSNIIYVSCMGLPFERNPQRGLYRSTDYGQTWEQILFAGEQAGVIDIALDPFDSETLYAASWDRIRNNQESVVNGPNAKIYKSTNGGNTWSELSGGLPTGDMGRIGLTMSATQPNLMYAMYVNTSNQLDNVYKSTNGGQTWAPIINWEDEELGMPQGILGGFGWYFGKIRLNPDNPNEIFILGVSLWKTYDGGDHWIEAAPPWWEYNVHADKHDLVYIGQDSFLLATDGGMYLATDQHTTWQDVERIATNQFYRVAYNPHKPDHYYGGTQDNGSVGGTTLENDWDRIWGGDGFQMQFHPQDTGIIFAESQRGNIVVILDGLSSGNWDSGTYGINDEDRRNWDMPYILSPHNPDVMYTGTYRVYKSEIGGVPYWEPISEGLTDSVTFGNSFHTISTLDESPLEAGLVYVGTTDGNVKRTANDGQVWVDITNGLPDRYITDIKASPEVANRVFVTVSGYKYNDFDPHIFQSDDRGDNWFSIAGDLPNLAINDVYVLPGHQDSVIFAGTDGGVYGTINGGDHWHRLGNNMPVIPVYDLEFNVARNELVAGTHARSIMSYNLDSILVMPEIINETSEVIQENKLTIFPSPAKDQISVGFSTTQPVKLSIIDLKGNIIYQTKTWSGEQIEVSHLSAGLYFIQINDSGQLWNGKFLKM